MDFSVTIEPTPGVTIWKGPGAAPDRGARGAPIVFEAGQGGHRLRPRDDLRRGFRPRAPGGRPQALPAAPPAHRRLQDRDLRRARGRDQRRPGANRRDGPGRGEAPLRRQAQGPIVIAKIAKAAGSGRRPRADADPAEIRDHRPVDQADAPHPGRGRRRPHRRGGRRRRLFRLRRAAASPRWARWSPRSPPTSRRRWSTRTPSTSSRPPPMPSSRSTARAARCSRAPPGRWRPASSPPTPTSPTSSRAMAAS